MCTCTLGFCHFTNRKKMCIYTFCVAKCASVVNVLAKHMKCPDLV